MLPTASVFAELNARTGLGAMQPPGTMQTVWDLVAYLADAANDLEAPASRLAPVIEDVLSALDREPGCVLAQMSGSGATCFGLFEQQQFALGAAERIAQDHPDWWVRVTRIAAPDIGAVKVETTPFVIAGLVPATHERGCRRIGVAPSTAFMADRHSFTRCAKRGPGAGHDEMAKSARFQSRRNRRCPWGGRGRASRGRASNRRDWHYAPKS